MRQTKTNTYTHLLTPQQKSLWCLVPGPCPFPQGVPPRSALSPPFFWCDRGEHVSTDPCWRESCLLHQALWNRCCADWAGAEPPWTWTIQCQEKKGEETLGLQAIPQLRGDLHIGTLDLRVICGNQDLLQVRWTFTADLLEMGCFLQDISQAPAGLNTTVGSLSSMRSENRVAGNEQPKANIIMNISMLLRQWL